MVFLAAVVFFAVDFLAGAAFLVEVDLLGATFFAAAAAFLAGAAAFFAAGAAAAAVRRGSFLAPETTFLRSAPAVNFGTEVFLALIRAPVWGLRTHRASRTRFSKEPNPVIATFSPLATSRVIVSRTESSAWAAALRFPSNRADSASMSCVLFTSFPSNEPRCRAGARLIQAVTLGTPARRHNHHAG